MSYGWWLLVVLFFILVGYVIWVTLLWATWNYTIPLLNNSISGATVPFSNISWPTAAVFVFLLCFLAVPISVSHKVIMNNFYVSPQVIEVEEEVVPVIRTEYMR